MKKLLLVFVAFLSATLAFAQTTTEVVYLKNGSIIKGTVTEQNMTNETIKLQTADGSIFVYKLDEIDKIEKVAQTQPAPQQVASNNTRQAAQPSYSDTYLKHGYRGFAGISLGVGTETEDISFFTTHGIQCNHFYYVGWGLRVHYGNGYYDDHHHDEYDAFSVIPYVDANIDFLRGGVSPFLDVKIGYSAGELTGFYDEASFGVRIKRCSLAIGCNTWNDGGVYAASGFFSVTIDFGARR